MAKPNKKPPTKVVDIYCSKCHQVLFKYRKAGKGSLVKCFVERITKDYTDEKCTCPKCQTVFAKEMLIRGTPAYKVISSRVIVR